MCGRYRIKDTDILTAHLRLTFGIPDWVIDRNRYNISPSQTPPIVAAERNGTPRLAPMRWGLIPHWDRSEKPKIMPINARSEEAFTKPMFRDSLQRRRCLIPADGFYEWRRLDDGKAKFPFDIHLTGGRPFLIAGIYEEATSLHPETYLLFTTRPNELMSKIHDRMPVILRNAEAARRWITPGEISTDDFAAIAEPYPANDMEAVEISSLVNSPRNDGPEVLIPAAELRREETRPAPAPTDSRQGELF